MKKKKVRMTEQDIEDKITRMKTYVLSDPKRKLWHLASDVDSLKKKVSEMQEELEKLRKENERSKHD